MWNLENARRVKLGEYNALVIPEHPRAYPGGRVLEHRVVMEVQLGRLLGKDEHVHHRDGNKTNNAPSNLEVLSPAEHARRHGRGRAVVTVTCTWCGVRFNRWANRVHPGNPYCSRSHQAKGRVRTALPEHGYGRYRRGCRCETCRAANASRMRDYGAKRRVRASVPATSEPSAVTARPLRSDHAVRGRPAA